MFFNVKICSRINIVNISRTSREYGSSLSESAESKKSSSKEISTSEEIVIPKRIPRGSTDILKALASTVGRDYTAPNYIYHDDPFLIPASNASKKTYALSKESGKKAARYFLQKYPDSFEDEKADPVIEAFNPRPVYTEDSDATESTLIECIGKREVDNSVLVYELLQKKGINVTRDSLQSFLELLCFYNCTNPDSEDLREERQLKQLTIRETRKAWKESSLAEAIFSQLKPKDSGAAYCALIQGMAKYFHVDQALNLYKEMREKQLPVNVGTYNSLILLVPFKSDSHERRWTSTLELLNAMSAEGVQPNIGTMNAVLNVFSKMRSWQSAKPLALNVMAEMKRLGIDPSLGSYYFLLLIFCRDKGPKSAILVDILDAIKGKEFALVHPFDTYFFVTAMDIAHNHNFDVDLAYRINDTLSFGNNYNLIGSSRKESIYYQHFFQLLSKCVDLNEMMQYYRKYVPNVYIPEPSVMLDILYMVDAHDELQYVPELWTDITVFGQLLKEAILEQVLSMIAKKKMEDKIQSSFVSIAWSIVDLVDNQDTNRMSYPVQLSAHMLSDVLSTCLNGEDTGKAWTIVHRLSKQQETISGVPHAAVLIRFCQASLENGDVEKALFCLHYALEVGHVEVGEFVKRLLDKNTVSNISEDAKAQIEAILPITIVGNNGEKATTKETSQ